tara:strand:- start:3046 stop:3417 length:372 start_codon:yes stop_codon:yes gene_type:complete
MNKIGILLLTFAMSSCSLSSITNLMPRDHDSHMVGHWVHAKMALDRVDCSYEIGSRGWIYVSEQTEALSVYTAFRNDPQAKNMEDLDKHVNKMLSGGSEKFCKLGIKIADGRLQAAKKAWSDR